MALLQKSRVRQVGHHVTNRSRTQAFAVGARQRARTYGLARGNKSLHNGRQNFAFPLADIWVRWHLNSRNFSGLQRHYFVSVPALSPANYFQLTILDAET